MKKLIKALIAVLFFSTAPLFAVLLPDEDLNKYRLEDLPKFTSTTFLERGFTDQNLTLTFEPQTEDVTFSVITNSNVCNILPDKFSTTIYDVNLKNGVVTCMFGEKGEEQYPSNLYHPIGLYEIKISHMKEYYAIDPKTAAEHRSREISQADELFSTLTAKKQEIMASLDNTAASYLTIPQILLAAILTDSDIVDVQASKATGKLQLQQGYTSKYTENNQVQNNEESLLVDSNVIFEVYAGISDLSVWYLMLLVVLFGGGALTKYGVQALSNKVESKPQTQASTPFFVGAVIAVLFFFPTENGDVNVDNFQLLKTNFQSFEKTGFYTFNDWANDAARVVIDAEVDGIITKSGIGTKEQIINAYAGQVEHQKKKTFYETNLNYCKQVYDYDSLKSWTLYKNQGFGLSNENLFPISEKYAVQAYLKHGDTYAYYNQRSHPTLKGLIPDDIAVVAGEYPKVAFSQCARALESFVYHTDLHKAHTDQLRGLMKFDGNEAGKIAILEKLVEFQYELYRDWGYLAILGLPVTKMQTEYIGGLYKDPTSEVVTALQKKLGEGSGGDYSIMSSIPYLFLPGIGTIYDVITSNSSTFGAAIGTASGGPVGGAIGAIAGKVFGGAIGLPIAYQAAKTLLEILPIVALVTIGLLRFIVIFVKIFTFHFASLFILPLMFARQNLEAISLFASKLITTMLELPIFVLSVWLAMTAHALLKSVGLVFSKSLMIGMLENSNVQYANSENWRGIAGYFNQLKVFFFDGLIEVAVSIFAIVLIYKIIVSLHTTIFELLEMKTSKTLDDSIEAMRRETTGSETKI